MLTIPGPPVRCGDRLSRRSWLQIGGLALGGLALPDILRAESKGGVRNEAKGIIMERFKIDDVRAFEMLRKLSQDTNTKLVDVAHRVIDTPAE